MTLFVLKHKTSYCKVRGHSSYASLKMEEGENNGLIEILS